MTLERCFGFLRPQLLTQDDRRIWRTNALMSCGIVIAAEMTTMLSERVLEALGQNVASWALGSGAVVGSVILLGARHIERKVNEADHESILLGSIGGISANLILCPQSKPLAYALGPLVAGCIAGILAVKNNKKEVV